MGKMLRTQQQCCCELVPRIESSVRETAVPSICKMIKTPSEYPSAPAGGLSSFGIPSDKRTQLWKIIMLSIGKSTINGNFQQLCQSLPEGNSNFSKACCYSLRKGAQVIWYHVAHSKLRSWLTRTCYRKPHGVNLHSIKAIQETSVYHQIYPVVTKRGLRENPL